MRDENGRFVPGQSGNPKGRAARRTEEEYLGAMLGRVTLKDWREIVDKAIGQAKRGDSKARQWLSDYIMGPPVQRLEHSGEGGGPVEFLVKYANGRNNPTDTA